ncbi:MAG: phosphoglucomutase/phosphomannomutase family protein [Bacteroidia bacterium]|nr:phosphoglucomutase/phosphomannomutase family protein [Bacteroidia bacterium]
MKIKFGTDGWRGIIAKDFTVDNVKRVAFATAEWLKKNKTAPSIVLGHDCRFGGDLFAETAASVFIANGIKVHMAKGFVSTPMISLGTVHVKADAGVIITASHNPPSYNGFKIKASFGGPATQSMIDEVEMLIPDQYTGAEASLEEAEKNGQLAEIDLETLYCEQIEKSFDLKLIKEKKLELAYDAMYGAGQNVIRRLFPEATLLHCEHNPGFMGQAPEPIHKNLYEFSEMIRISEEIDCGLVTDGDADRIGLYNKKGEFIDSHHIILLLIHYLHKYKKLDGKVITTFSAASKIRKMCEAYGLPVQITKIGFKYICEYMIKEKVLVGGEESGGIAITGHIPERDGIWIGLTIWEFMAKTGKSLDELIAEVYEVTGTFAMERNDLHLQENQKNSIIEKCQTGQYKNFGSYRIVNTESIDGFKFHLHTGDWVMIRPSGTEPVLRTYAEAPDSKTAFDILEQTKNTILL